MVDQEFHVLKEVWQVEHFKMMYYIHASLINSVILLHIPDQ